MKAIWSLLAICLISLPACGAETFRAHLSGADATPPNAAAYLQGDATMTVQDAAIIYEIHIPNYVVNYERGRLVGEHSDTSFVFDHTVAEVPIGGDLYTPTNPGSYTYSGTTTVSAEQLAELRAGTVFLSIFDKSGTNIRGRVVPSTSSPGDSPTVSAGGRAAIYEGTVRVQTDSGVGPRQAGSQRCVIIYYGDLANENVTLTRVEIRYTAADGRRAVSGDRRLTVDRQQGVAFRNIALLRVFTSAIFVDGRLISSTMEKGKVRNADENSSTSLPGVLTGHSFSLGTAAPGSSAVQSSYLREEDTMLRLRQDLSKQSNEANDSLAAAIERVVAPLRVLGYSQ